MDAETALKDLEKQGYFIWDHFFNLEETQAINLDYQHFYASGEFQRAGTGNESGPSIISNLIRTDETYWIDPNAMTETQTFFWDRLESLKEKINEKFFLGLWSFSGHYSRYPVDGFYGTHLDRFQGNDQRTMSMVLYLNDEWVAADGGELRLHFPNEILKQLDVSPIAGRLVCFLSASVPHEVLISHKVRLSFAGWWKRRST